MRGSVRGRLSLGTLSLAQDNEQGERKGLRLAGLILNVHKIVGRRGSAGKAVKGNDHGKMIFNFSIETE